MYLVRHHWDTGEEDCGEFSTLEGAQMRRDDLARRMAKREKITLSEAHKWFHVFELRKIE
jgi:hypothetical protein